MPLNFRKSLVSEIESVSIFLLIKKLKTYCNHIFAFLALVLKKLNLALVSNIGDKLNCELTHPGYCLFLALNK